MGSGDWLKNIISINKARKQKANKTKDFLLAKTDGFMLKSRALEEPKYIVKRVANGHYGVSLLTEDIAAIRIQTAFRAFKARKCFCDLKRILRLQLLMEGEFGKKQSSNTLRNFQSWSRIQTQIRTCRLSMVEDKGIKQKKLEKLKLDAKVRDLEAEWSNSSHTMVEALARIKQREEATVKRERAMAYAFSHQWRAHHSNASLLPNDSEVASSNWGWSWMDRWIAARPSESRALVVSAPKKVNGLSSKKSPSTKSNSLKKSSPKGKKTSRNRRLSYGSTAKPEDAKTKPEKQTTK